MGKSASCQGVVERLRRVEPQPSGVRLACATLDAQLLRAASLHYNSPISPQISATASLISLDVYGAVANDATLNFRIGGANGCFWNIPANIPGWVRGDSPGNCLASSYSLSGSAGNTALFSVSGSLPAPRQWSPSDQVLITSQGGGSIQATWNLADLKPEDQLTLDLISAKFIGGILPTGESKDSLTCNVSAAGNSFLVQPDEAQWLRSLGEPGGGIRAAQVSLATFLPGSAGVTSPAPPGAPDVFLLLISNRLAASSPTP